MPKKTFTFATPSAAEETAPPEVDLQIIKKTVDDGVRELEGARMIALERLRPDPTQPRRNADPQALEELAESIRQEGVLQPLLVRYRYEEDDFMIIAGERRYRAAQLAGLHEVPAIIKNVGGAQRYVLQLMENLQREDLNPIDKGRALEHLKTIMPGNWQQMADLVGLTRRRVEQLRALARLPPPLQDAVRVNRISEDHARALARLPEPYQGPALAAAESNALSTRRTKALVQRIQESLSLASPGDELAANAATAPQDTAANAAVAPRDTAANAAVAPRDTAASATEAPESRTAIAGRAIGMIGRAPEEVVRGATEALLRGESARGPRSRLAVPVYEKALEFERVLDRMPALEFQEDRALLDGIFARIEDKISRIRGKGL